MKKPSMTQGTKAHSSAVKMKAEQNAAMKMKKEAAMKMAANQQPMQAPAQPMAAPQQPAQQPMQQAAPTMMKKESPTKMKMKSAEVKPGSAADEKTRRARVEKYAKGKKHVGTKRTPEQLRSLAAKAEKAGSTDAAKKMRAKAGRAETEKGRAADYLKKNSPAAMKKAPLKKPLVGKQKNLPEEIKKKILAAPTKMKKKSPATKKDPVGDIQRKNAEALKATLKPGYKGSPKATANTKKFLKERGLTEVPDKVDLKKRTKK